MDHEFATGPGATPLVDGDQSHLLDAAGMLRCFDAATGDLVWRIDTTPEYRVPAPLFGVSHSLLGTGEHRIVLLAGEPRTQSPSTRRPAPRRGG